MLLLDDKHGFSSVKEIYLPLVLLKVYVSSYTQWHDSQQDHQDGQTVDLLT